MNYFKHKYFTLFYFIYILCVVDLNAQDFIATDTTIIFKPANPNLIRPHGYSPNIQAWGLDLLMSNNGFGIGVFYRYEIFDDYSLMINFLISDVKDDAEFERYDYYYGYSIIPGKKNRLLLMPLMASIQYRLFSEDIMDNFRPYVTAGLGPTMVFVAPYSKYYMYQLGNNSWIEQEKIDFFSSLKYGKLKYTLGGFVGAGAYFGIDKGSLTGISIKYIYAPFPDGIEVMYGGFIRNFGGFFINLTFGSLF